MIDWLIDEGKTDITLPVRLYDAFNGNPKTGLTIANLQIRYIRVEDDNDVTISSWTSLAVLGALTDAHADNYGYEIGEGYYRIDVPDAVCAAGASRASLLVQDRVDESIMIESVHIQLKDFLDAQLSTIAGYLDTEIAAIKAVTDNLPNSGALSDIDTGVNNIEALISDSKIAAQVKGMDADVITASALNADAIDEIHDEVVEGSITLRQAIRLFLSLFTGKSSGGGTTTITFRDIADSKNRLQVTVDNQGNRTDVGTRDGS